MPSEDDQAELYDTTLAVMSEAGFHQYEVSNYARTTSTTSQAEAEGHESRHNISYWDGSEYIGIGPGAAGRLTVLSPTSSPSSSPNVSIRTAFRQERSPLSWMKAVENRGIGVAEEEPLSWPRQINVSLLLPPSSLPTPVTSLLSDPQELLLSGLRTRQGVSQRTFRSRAANRSFREVLGDCLVDMERAGFVELVGGGESAVTDDKDDEMRLVATCEGLRMLNTLLVELILPEQ